MHYIVTKTLNRASMSMSSRKRFGLCNFRGMKRSQKETNRPSLRSKDPFNRFSGIGSFDFERGVH